MQHCIIMYDNLCSDSCRLVLHVTGTGEITTDFYVHNLSCEVCSYFVWILQCWVFGIDCKLSTRDVGTRPSLRLRILLVLAPSNKQTSKSSYNCWSEMWYYLLSQLQWFHVGGLKFCRCSIVSVNLVPQFHSAWCSELLFLSFHWNCNTYVWFLDPGFLISVICGCLLLVVRC